MRAALAPLVVGFLLGAAGCDETAAAPEADAALMPMPDAGAGRDGAASASPSVDFVASGCPRGLPARCEGVAPLTVTFSAVTGGVSGALTWDFGDGTPAARGAVVRHTYAAAGRYDVSLSAAAAGGTLSERKAGFVVVSPAPPGAACAEDRNCVKGARCVCRKGGCGPVLTGGLCLLGCGSAACPSGSLCVDLTPAAGPSAPAYRARLCLPACTAGKPCGRAGFTCRPAPLAGGGWRRACLPPLPRDVGDPCRTAAGKLDPAACLGRRCLDLGARGYCSATCSSRGCPEGSRCVRLAGVTGEVCLRRCGSGATGCDRDPLLRCEAPNAAGRFGFTVTGPADPPGTTYCAPRRCRRGDDCGLGGRCDLAAGGFCRGS